MEDDIIKNGSPAQDSSEKRSPPPSSDGSSGNKASLPVSPIIPSASSNPNNTKTDDFVIVPDGDKPPPQPLVRNLSQELLSAYKDTSFNAQQKPAWVKKPDEAVVIDIKPVKADPAFPALKDAATKKPSRKKTQKPAEKSPQRLTDKQFAQFKARKHTSSGCTICGQSSRSCKCVCPVCDGMSLDCDCDLKLINKVLSGTTVADALAAVEKDKITAKKDADDDRKASDLKSSLSPETLKSMYKIGFTAETAKQEYESWSVAEAEIMFSDHKRICASYFTYKNSLAKLQSLDRRVDHKHRRQTSRRFYLTDHFPNIYFRFTDKALDVFGLLIMAHHIGVFMWETYWSEFSFLYYFYTMFLVLFWHIIFQGTRKLLRLRIGTYIVAEQCFFYPESESPPTSQYELRAGAYRANHWWIIPIPSIYRYFYPDMAYRKKCNKWLLDYHSDTRDKKFNVEFGLKKTIDLFIRNVKDVRSGKDADYDMLHASEFGFKAHIIRSVFFDKSESGDGIVSYVDDIITEEIVSGPIIANALGSAIANHRKFDDVELHVRRGVSLAAKSTNVDPGELYMKGKIFGSTYIALWLASRVYVAEHESKPLSRDSF
jgi:hypothetical protein